MEKDPKKLQKLAWLSQFSSVLFSCLSVSNHFNPQKKHWPQKRPHVTEEAVLESRRKKKNLRGPSTFAREECDLPSLGASKGPYVEVETAQEN